MERFSGRPNGHTVRRLDLVPEILPCTGCRVCWTNGRCILDDDYPIVAQAIREADYIFMYALYYWWVSAT